jgi:hypothetical protein
MSAVQYGTNGIQAMDLMGRKMKINQGASFLAFKKEINKFCKNNKSHPELGDRINGLIRVKDRLFDMAEELKNKMKSDPLQWASYTYPAMLAFSETIMIWRLLDLARIAYNAIEKGWENDFYMGKISQATFFTDITLPHVFAKVETCLRTGKEITELSDGAF